MKQYYLPLRYTEQEAAAIMATLKKSHARRGLREIKRVRLCKLWGWSNQPHVVCFSSIFGLDYIRNYIQPTVDALFPNSANIQEKDF